jgi:hypothetical protein
MIITDRARTGYAKLSSLGKDIRLRELETRFGGAWDSHREAVTAPTGTSDGHPLVSGMDIVLGLYQLGLATRADIDKLTSERRRRQAEAPVGVQIEREMREAFRSTRRVRSKGKPAAQRRDTQASAVMHRR